jgi:hypothetical protein
MVNNDKFEDNGEANNSQDNENVLVNSLYMLFFFNLLYTLLHFKNLSNKNFYFISIGL